MDKARRFVVGFAVMAIAASQSFCGGQGAQGTRAKLAVEVNKQNVENGATVQFNKDQDPLSIVVWNTGTRPLEIETLKLEDGGNADVQLIDKDFELLDQTRKAQYGYDPEKPVTDLGLFFGLPTSLENTSIANELLEFQAVYQPQTLGGEDTVLRIDSNDTTDTPFFLTIQPYVKAPKIAVTPNNYTFVNATKSNPGFADFTITNVGSDALRINGISFKNPTDEFEVTNPPNQGTMIYPAGSGAGLTELKFTVRYAPIDTPDENQVLVKSNDPTAPSVGIVVRGETQAGQISITYGDQAAGCMDFQKTINPGEMCTKVVNVANVGPGIVNVKKPVIEQGDDTAYTLEWYQVGGVQVDDGKGCGEFQGTPINGPLYSLAEQRSLDIAVTYTASGAKGVNGILVLNYASPTEGKAEIPMCGGSPKGEIDIAPPKGSQVTFMALDGQTSEKTVVIMNKGNGDLTIRGLKIVKAFPELDPDAFTIKTDVAPDTIIPKWGLLPITIEFNTDYDNAIYLNATMEITYLDPNTDQDTTIDASLKGSKDIEGVDLPVADPGSTTDYADAKAGQALILNGAGSVSGSFPIYDQGYTWFVSKKPANSSLFLNQSGTGPQVAIIPDVAGEYEFRLVVFSLDDANNLFYFSNEAAVTVNVQP
ncbi:MAG: hypothetical protein GXP54_13445 [Deltaproteobacteria bacterium]|nr:hypothetical protein [Deltaproteobacteria bacterium]